MTVFFQPLLTSSALGSGARPWPPCSCFKVPAQVRDGVYQVPQEPGASSDVHDFVQEYASAGLFDTVLHGHVAA